MKHQRILGIGDWGLGIEDWAQSPIPNTQSPIPNPHLLIVLELVIIDRYHSLIHARIV
jgi:hypothetical protein